MGGDGKKPKFYFYFLPNILAKNKAVDYAWCLLLLLTELIIIPVIGVINAAPKNNNENIMKATIGKI
jgi:hypothetical protein